jgi:hypothetical protein
MSRPWLAEARSNEFEWNGRVGARFATEERAMARARQYVDDGLWDVEVWFAPVPMRVWDGSDSFVSIGEAPRRTWRAGEGVDRG